MRPSIVQQRLINLMAATPGAEITRRQEQNRYELLGSYVQNGRTVHQMAFHRWIQRLPGDGLRAERFGLTQRGRELSLAEPVSPKIGIVDLARIAIDAYEDRFGSTTSRGNLLGPIDEEMLELRAAVYPNGQPKSGLGARKTASPISDPQPGRETLLEALLACQRLFREALPKFNWGASCLDANAITLLNEVPPKVERVLAGLPPP